jgi:hypothetical protein
MFLNLFIRKLNFLWREERFEERINFGYQYVNFYENRKCKYSTSMKDCDGSKYGVDLEVRMLQALLFVHSRFRPGGKTLGVS